MIKLGCNIADNKLNQGRLSSKWEVFKYIPVIFQAASLLAALSHPGHIVIYAPGDSLPCRRDATRNLLGIIFTIYQDKS